MHNNVTKKAEEKPKEENCGCACYMWCFGYRGSVCSRHMEAAEKKLDMETDSASVSSEENTSESITYKGKTYVYNDHLSNYLFYGN